MTARYNLSRHDRVRSFHVAGPVEGVRLYENAVYTAPGETVTVAQFSDWDGYGRDVEFRGNLFVAEGAARYGQGVKGTKDGNHKYAAGYGDAENVRFAGNTYVGQHRERPAETAGGGRLKAMEVPWEGPRFDPSRPEGFEKYLKAHRAWLARLLEAQFGRRVN